MRIDLHCHTHYSGDSLSTLGAILKRMDDRNLDMVAITDHNTIAGAQAFHAQAPDRFLVGEEIKSRQGEVIGLFLEEEVPAGLTLQETIDRIRDQGGLVGASHPLDSQRSESMGRKRWKPSASSWILWRCSTPGRPLPGTIARPGSWQPVGACPALRGATPMLRSKWGVPLSRCLASVGGTTFWTAWPRDRLAAGSAILWFILYLCMPSGASAWEQDKRWGVRSGGW